MAVTILILSACTAAEPTGPALRTYQGEPLSTVAKALPDDVATAVVDVSVLFGTESSYANPTDWGRSQWMVLALCADAPVLEAASTAQIAVAPSDLLTSDDEPAAREGEYEAKTVACDGLDYRGTDPADTDAQGLN